MFESLTVRVGADISDFRAGIAKAFSSAKDLGASLGDAFKDLKQNAIAAGAAITATLGTATALTSKAAADYEQNLAAISTVVDLTADGLKELGNGQRALAKEFGADLGAQMRGLYDALSAGVTNAATATDHMRAVNKLAVAGITDVDVAGQALIRMMRAYGPETMTAARASDILLQISNKGVTTFAQLAPGIGKVAGLAAQAGVSAEEMGAALATITGTASTDESITQLTALIGDIVRPMDGARKMADELGLEFGAVALSTQGLGGIMSKLRATLGITVTKELAGMIAAGADTNVILDEMATKSGVQIQKLAELFPNVNSLRAALALMAGEGSAFSDNLGAMAKATGATDSAFSKMAGTMAEDYKKAKAAVLDLQISIGQALEPALKLMGESLLPVVDRINAWIQANPELASNIADVAVQILAGAAALGAFGVAMSGISSVVGIATASLRILAISVSSLGLLFTPVGLAVAAVGAVVGYFVYQWVQDVGGVKEAWRITVETITRYGAIVVEWFRQNWPAIRETIVSTWNSIVEFLKPIVTDVWNFIKEITGGLVGWFRENWPAISEIFAMTWAVIQSFWESIGRPLWDMIAETIRLAWELVKDIVRGAGQAIGGIIEVFMGIITGDWTLVWTGIKDIAEGIWTLLKGAWSFFFGSLSNIMETVGGLLAGAWTLLWTGLKNTFTAIVDTIVGYFKAAFDKITGWITGIFGWVGKLGAAIGGGLSGGFAALRDIVGFNEGGWIAGDGGVDQNLARVSDGEFVVNARSASEFGPLLEAINGIGAGGGGNSYFGNVSVSLPNARYADSRGLRELSAGLERIRGKGQKATNRRGLR